MNRSGDRSVTPGLLVENVDFCVSPPSAKGSIPLSLAIKAASIPRDAAVPPPGIVLAAPDANSKPAPRKSPFAALSNARNVPIPRPTKGILLPINLAAPFLTPVSAASLPAVLSTVSAVSFPSAFSNNFPLIFDAALPPTPLASFNPLPARTLPITAPPRTFAIDPPTPPPPGPDPLPISFAFALPEDDCCCSNVISSLRASCVSNLFWSKSFLPLAILSSADV